MFPESEFVALLLVGKERGYLDTDDVIGVLEGVELTPQVISTVIARVAATGIEYRGEDAHVPGDVPGDDVPDGGVAPDPDVHPPDAEDVGMGTSSDGVARPQRPPSSPKPCKRPSVSSLPGRPGSKTSNAARSASWSCPWRWMR